MKKIITILTVAILFGTAANAQTQKDWYLIGGNLSNINLGLQKGNTSFGFSLSPKVAWFVSDNFALGGEVGFGINTGKGFTNTSYNIGPLARYYFKDNALDKINKTRWFGEANVGFNGENRKLTGTSAVNSNGLGIGVGPGLAYFINQNIALEGLVKYQLTLGFGDNNVNTNGINFGLGFQIYLPKSKIKDMRNDIN